MNSDIARRISRLLLYAALQRQGSSESTSRNSQAAAEPEDEENKEKTEAMESNQAQDGEDHKC